MTDYTITERQNRKDEQTNNGPLKPVKQTFK